MRHLELCRNSAFACDTAFSNKIPEILCCSRRPTLACSPWGSCGPQIQGPLGLEPGLESLAPATSNPGFYKVEWPTDFWESGRVLATQHYLGHQVVTMITVYGLPRGPTWPKAAQLTNELLAFITKEFVIGYSGIVIVAGDYNFGPHELSSFDAWRKLWVLFRPDIGS